MEADNIKSNVLQNIHGVIVENNTVKEFILIKILLPLFIFISFFCIAIPMIMLDEIGDSNSWVQRKIEILESTIKIQAHSATIRGSYYLVIKIRDIKANITTTNVRVSFVAKETSEWHFNESEQHKQRYKDIQKMYPVGKVFTAFASPDLEKYYFEKPDVFIIKLIMYSFVFIFLFLIILKRMLGKKSRKS